MKKFILILLVILGCKTKAVYVPERPDYAGYQITGQEMGFGYSAQTTKCLRDLIVNEMSGGRWTLLEKPIGSTLTQPFIDSTDNPCINFDSLGCGRYRFQYTISDTCCIDSSIVRINKRCCNVVGTLICNN